MWSAYANVTVVLWCLAVNCAIMQKSGAGLHTANSCYWDTATDGEETCTSLTFYPQLFSPVSHLRVPTKDFVMSQFHKCDSLFSRYNLQLCVCVLLQCVCVCSVVAKILSWDDFSVLIGSPVASVPQEAARSGGRIAPCTAL